MDKATWKNTRLVKGNIVEEVSKMKREPGDNMVIMGTIVSTEPRAVDRRIPVHRAPTRARQWQTLFEGVKELLPLKRVNSRTFGNGNVLLTYVLE